MGRSIRVAALVCGLGLMVFMGACALEGYQSCPACGTNGAAGRTNSGTTTDGGAGADQAAGKDGRQQGGQLCPLIPVPGAKGGDVCARCGVILFDDKGEPMAPPIVVSKEGEFATISVSEAQRAFEEACLLTMKRTLCREITNLMLCRVLYTRTLEVCVSGTSKWLAGQAVDRFEGQRQLGVGFYGTCVQRDGATPLASFQEAKPGGPPLP